LQTYSQFSVSVGVSIRVPPPVLPVYTQPPCPVEGYLWTPGYWAYGDLGYYWVPGVWVSPPMVGFLWTPGYWGYGGGIYGWHGGYWGSHIGFYGGVNYGGGYAGVGFVGGMWTGGAFRYNTAVMNVNTTIVHNTYVNNTVVNNTTVVNNRASFNGQGGVTATANVQEQAAMRENHVQPTSEQFSHNQTASQDRNQLASVNGGRPATTAMNRVGGDHFNGQGHFRSPHPNGQSSAYHAPNNNNRSTLGAQPQHSNNNHPQHPSNHPNNHHKE
jgi:WXXGXW repeat (2 copies)